MIFTIRCLFLKEICINSHLQIYDIFVIINADTRFVGRVYDTLSDMVGAYHSELSELRIPERVLHDKSLSFRGIGFFTFRYFSYYRSFVGMFQ